MDTRKLGSQGLEVAEQGLGCMGMSRVLRRGRRRRVDRHDPPRARARRDAARHRRHVRAVHQRASSSAARSPTGATQVVLATKFGNVARRERRAPRHQRHARVRAPGAATRRCSASASTTSTSTTSTASTRQVPIEETVGAMAELVARRQGALPRPVGGGAGDDPPRARGAPDRRAADRVLAVDARRRGARSCPPPASSASASWPTARSAAAS